MIIAMMCRWASLNCKNEWRCLCNLVSPFSKWHSWREVKVAQRFSKYVGKKKKNYVLPAGPDGRRRAAERLSRLGEKMSRHKSGNTDAEQKTRNIPECDRMAISECKTEPVK